MKKLFSVFVAALFCTALLADQKIYFKATQDFWNWLDGGVQSATAIYAWDGESEIAGWPGIRMSKVEGEEFVWVAEIGENFQNAVFVRVNAEGPFTEQGLKTKDLVIPTDGKNLYTITAESVDWSDPELWSKGIQEGEWSVYEAPAVPQPELPTVAIAASFNDWNKDANILEPAEDSKSASTTIHLGVDHYQLKVVLNGTDWMTKYGGDGELFKIHRDWPKAEQVDQKNVDENNLLLVADVEGDYVFTWIYADSTLLITFPEIPEEKEVFYLVGTITNWQVVADAPHTFCANPGAEGEFLLDFNLSEGDGIKVVGVKGEAQTWYIEGEGNEFIADAAHSGDVTIYFRPEANPEWSDLAGHIYVAKREPQGINNTAAEVKVVKFFENGQLIIEKNGVRYNAQGAVVK